MKDTLGKFYSLLDSPARIEKKRTYEDVANHPGCEVRSFAELTEAVAKLGFYNQNFNLFFRGQVANFANDGLQGRHKRTSLLPWAFRADISSTKERSAKYLNDVLPRMAGDLMAKFGRKLAHPGPARKALAHFDEKLWAVLQHYECPTPLLDITQSLHVASSFATRKLETDTLKDDVTESGYVYVLGLPNINGDISFFAYEGLVIVKLQAACPPEAKRPHYQKGYLVGSIPHTPQDYKYKHRDFRLRLIAKFHIPDANAFWNGSGYKPLGKQVLKPDDDEIEKMVARIRDKHLAKFKSELASSKG